MKFSLLCLAICIGLVFTEAPNYDDLIASLITTDMTPNPRPERPETGIQTIKLRALSVNFNFFLYIGPANLFWRCQANLGL